MKRITAFICAALICLMFSVVSFAENIYIVDDAEEDFVPDVTTTTQAAETTTSSSIIDTDSILGGIETISGYFGDFSGVLGDGIDSLLSGFENFDVDIDMNQDTPETTTLPKINSGEKITQSQYAEQLTSEMTENVLQQETTTVRENELPSVLVVNGENNSNDVLSGSTLTLLVFISAIVLLILVAAIVLVMLTRKTEYNSAVLDKSTIPSVDKPSALSQFLDDDISDDGNDYGNIAYWNDKNEKN